MGSLLDSQKPLFIRTNSQFILTKFVDKARLAQMAVVRLTRVADCPYWDGRFGL
jgi:hypothetical protein